MKAIHKEKYQEQDRDVPTLCLTIMIMFMVMTMYKTTSILFTVFSRTETWEGRKPFMSMTHRSHFQEMSDAEVYPLLTPTCYTTCVSTVEPTCRIGETLRSVYFCDTNDTNEVRRVGWLTGANNTTRGLFTRTVQLQWWTQGSRNVPNRKQTEEMYITRRILVDNFKALNLLWKHDMEMGALLQLALWLHYES